MQAFCCFAANWYQASTGRDNANPLFAYLVSVYRPTSPQWRKPKSARAPKSAQQIPLEVLTSAKAPMRVTPRQNSLRSMQSLSRCRQVMVSVIGNFVAIAFLIASPLKHLAIDGVRPQGVLLQSSQARFRPSVTERADGLRRDRTFEVLASLLVLSLCQ